MLHKQKTPEKLKDVQKHLNGEISSRKNKVQKNAWNVKMACFFLSMQERMNNK